MKFTFGRHFADASCFPILYKGMKKYKEENNYEKTDYQQLFTILHPLLQKGSPAETWINVVTAIKEKEFSVSNSKEAACHSK